jgi:hypothetical protein
MTVGHASGDEAIRPSGVADDRLLTGPTAALLCLEREGLVVRVVEPPFDLGLEPAWRLTAAGSARSLALLRATAVRVELPADAGGHRIAAAGDTPADQVIHLPHPTTT